LSEGIEEPDVTPPSDQPEPETHDFFKSANAVPASAAAKTVLYPGDIIAGPAFDLLESLEAGARVSIEVDGIGVLEQRVAG